MQRVGAAILAVASAVSALPAAGRIVFRETVYPVLEKANCRGCHAGNGVAAASRLHFPESGAGGDDIEAFGVALSVLIDPANPEESPLLKKPTNRTKHTGGRLIVPGSAEERILREWVQFLVEAKPAVSQRPVQRPTVAPMRRLTHSQYNRTVRDLLGDRTGPASQFPPEDFVNGFKNQADTQSVPALLAEAYSAAAEKLARNALREPDRFLPCRPRSGVDRACRDRFLRDFGGRAFRRPLSGAEGARYATLFGSAKDPLHGAALVVEAMLQSPAFLFRVEKNPSRPNGYEIASRLSYFLWDTMPDGELFRAAAAGELNTPAGVERQARRMLADPRARESLDEFVSQWMRFDRVLNTVRDRQLFPQFTVELAWAMTEETRRLIADAVWMDRDFMTVFRAGYGFLNADLANLYQAPTPANDFDRVDFPATGERGGLLGQATFLTLTSKPSETSPTARGLFVREQFLCQHVPDPPPGANANLPPLSESKPQTNRERLAVHLSNASCSTCHRLIDPIGFGLEKFDAIGARREKLKLVFPENRGNKQPMTVELALDTSGEISGITDSVFSSPRDLGAVLARNSQCQECVIKQLFRYGFGRQETPADRPALRAVFDRFKDSGFKLKEALVAMAATSAGFVPDRAN